MEIDLQSPATKQDAATYCENYFKAHMQPVAIQANQTALLLNLLLDFLGAIGFHKSSSGRLYRLDPTEFKEFIQHRMKAQQAQQPPIPPENQAQPETPVN